MIAFQELLQQVFLKMGLICVYSIIQLLDNLVDKILPIMGFKPLESEATALTAEPQPLTRTF